MSIPRHLLPALLLGLAALPAAAQAPAGGLSANARVRALRSVTTACQAETQLYCPADVDAGPRNAVICLKDVRSNLSLPCRRAVVAALQ